MRYGHSSITPSCLTHEKRCGWFTYDVRTADNDNMLTGRIMARTNEHLDNSGRCARRKEVPRAGCKPPYAHRVKAINVFRRVNRLKNSRFIDMAR
jgi:hypothetical protein